MLLGMVTGTEKLIRTSRAQTDTLLVSKLNELLKSPIGIESDNDVAFLTYLAQLQVRREQERKKGQGVFSPSGLASCLRRVYLSKNWKELGLTRVDLPAIEPHYYFITGDFIHLKWQFLMYRLSLVDPDFTLIDCEVPIMSKRGDHGGTIDVVALADGELIIVDVKGLNIRGFQKIDAGEAEHNYRIQVTDYMMLWNAAVTRGLIKPSAEHRYAFKWAEFPKINRAVILAESKGGPDMKHPAALTEQIVKLKDNLPDVRTRLELLRAHEEEGTLPEIECVTTKGIQFQGCPFAGICQKEVKKRERENAKSGDSKQYRVARPKRSDRPRRPRSK